MAWRVTWTMEWGTWGLALFLGLFGLGWGALTLACDVGLACGLYEQVRSLTFAVTQGKILESRVHEGYDDGPIYSIELEYEYDVADHHYVSEQFRAFHVTGSRRYAYDTVAAFPPGSVVSVYYDPDDPQNAVLARDLQMGDLFIPITLFPCNLVLVGIWAMAFAMVCEPAPEALPWFTRVLDRPGGQIVRLPGIPCTFVALCAAGITAFALTFVLGFGCELNDPLWLAGLGWALVLGAGVTTYVWARRKVESGEFDLVLDHISNTVSVPGSDDPQRPRVSLDIAEIAACSIQMRTVQSGDVESKRYATQFVTRDGSRHEIYEWYTQDEARRLATWLASRLGLAECTFSDR